MRFKLWLESTQDIRFYQRDSHQYGFLSNFFPAPFELDGVRFPTLEHYYVYMKSEDQSFRDRISSAETPGRAKRLGDDKHKKSLFVQGQASKRPDWEQVKFQVMERGVQAKFEQNPELMAKLQATAPMELLEDSPTDLVWGTGHIDEQGNYPGKNMLGVILMKVRGGRGYTESSLLPAEQVLAMVMSSYYSKKNNVNPEKYAERWGIQGDFEQRAVPVETLVHMVRNHRLFISPSKTEQGVIEKVKSGHRNPVIITKPGDFHYPYVVVDGNHSLDAAARAGDETIEVIMPVGTKL